MTKHTPGSADPALIRTSVHLTETQLKALRAINRRTGVPVAFLIRRGVDWVIQQESGHRRAKR